MAIVDQQGRLFGRLNLLDAAVVLLVFALIPLGYASWIVFRTPPPQLTSVEPAVLMAEPSVRIVLHGVNFRPFMRASLGNRQGWDFFFRDSTHAEVIFKDMAPGVYDVILYDFEKERARLPQAITITKTPVPAAQMVVVGWLGNLKTEQVAHVTPGMILEGFGEVTKVGRPLPQSTRVFSGPDTLEVRDPSALRVPVAVRMGCNIRSREGHPVCVVGEIDLRPGILLMAATPFGLLPFEVNQMQSSAPLESVRVAIRFQADPRIIALMKKGDVDLPKTASELASGATVVEVLAPRPEVREATIALEAQRDPGGWVYQNQPLRVGTSFTLRTPAYEVTGMVLAIDPDKSK